MLCTKCHLEKNNTEFSFKNQIKGIRKKICKACHSLYRKQHYLQNKKKYIEKANKWNTKQRDLLRKYLYELLARSQCIDCGEKDIIVLEFDHLRNKKISIANMFRNRYSISAIEQEIKKCVIRCANCHRKKTAKERGTWKFRILELEIT